MNSVLNITIVRIFVFGVFLLIPLQSIAFDLDVNNISKQDLVKVPELTIQYVLRAENSAKSSDYMEAAVMIKLWNNVYELYKMDKINIVIPEPIYDYKTMIKFATFAARDGDIEAINIIIEFYNSEHHGQYRNPKHVECWEKTLDPSIIIRRQRAADCTRRWKLNK